MTNRRYKELIFTDHALQRLNQRQIEMSEAWAAWRRPSHKYYAATKGGWVCERTWNHRQIEVVVTQNDRKEPVVISVWSNYVHTKTSRPLWLKLLKWIWKKIW